MPGLILDRYVSIPYDPGTNMYRYAKLWIIAEPDSNCVLLPSESRYLWTSNIKLVLFPSGLWTVLRFPAGPLLMNVCAEVKSFPGSKIICVVAPACRIAVTAAYTLLAQIAISGILYGSFMTPKTTLVWLAYLEESQLLWNSKRSGTKYLFGVLRPQVCKLGVGWSSLTNDFTWSCLVQVGVRT
jgi:hypothetical protein